jgi:hypothetical protein
MSRAKIVVPAASRRERDRHAPRAGKLQCASKVDNRPAAV